MQDVKIVKVLLNILLGITIFIYPIGKVLTSPEKINSVLDKSDFETIVINFFTSYTTEQYEQTISAENTNSIQQLKDSLINKEALKLQRTSTVITLFDNISNAKVPKIKLDLLDPTAAIKNSITSTTQNFFQNFTDLFNKLLGKTTTKTSNPALNPEIYSIDTSFGITDSNINKVNTIYRFLRYGSDILVISCLALLAIGYIATIPNTLFARNEIFAAIKTLAITLFSWGIIPVLFKFFNPSIIQGQQASVNIQVNGIIGNLLFEIAKTAFFIPIIYLTIAILVWLMIILYKRASIAYMGFGRYTKEREEVEIDNIENTDTRELDSPAENDEIEELDDKPTKNTK